MGEITAAVLARDNEKIIGDCLASLQWADECLVVLDDRSSDRTREIAKEYGARIIVNRFDDFAQQRNHGLSQTHTEWLFYVDSDERCTPSLAQEIRQAIAQQQEIAGWWVPRLNIIWGHETRHGGWYPDFQLRVLRTDKARYDPLRRVHEVVLLDGQEGTLSEPLIHHNYETVGHFIAKQRQYVDLEAHIRLAEGIRPKPRSYVSQPLKEFWRRFVSLQGYKDGWHGFKLCALVAYYYGFMVTVRLAQLRRQEADLAA